MTTLRSTRSRAVFALLLLATMRSAAQTPSGLAIHDIQGSALTSPLVNQVVTTSGVVTGRKSNGFFLEAPDDQVDADAATSEGVFVFTSAAPPANVTTGTLITISGRVLEFVPAADPGSPSFTELGDPLTITVRGTGSPLPTPIEITRASIDPRGGVHQLERFEGMRVRIASLTTTSPTLGSVNEANATGSSNGVFYGVLTGTPRPFREPGVDVTSTLPAGSPCCVPRFDTNPERIRVDSDGLTSAPAINVSSGALVENLVGPLDYGFRSYTVLPDPETRPRVTGGMALAPAPSPEADEYTIASFNMQRFFDTSNDPSVDDVVLTPSAFAARLAKASRTIRDVLALPDVLGVQEVENLQTLQALASAVNRDAQGAGQGDPRYEAYLAEGNDPGGIDVGVLVKRARVETLAAAQEGKDDLFRNPTTGRMEVLNDRPPLTLRARFFGADDDDVVVTIVVNHLRSLIGIDDPDDGARVRAKRAAQAEYLASLIQRRRSDEPGDRIVSIGDYNAFQFNDGFVDVVGAVRGAPAAADQTVTSARDLVGPDLFDLIDAAAPDQRYSYVFDGSAQDLDHIVVSGALLPYVSRLVIARCNADFAEVLRSDPQRPERLSDHDPIIVYLKFRPVETPDGGR